MKLNNKIKKILSLTAIGVVVLCNTVAHGAEIDAKESYKVASSSLSQNEIEQNEKENNFLKSLEVDGYDIYPEFNKHTTTYYVTVPTDVKSIEVNAEAENEELTPKISGTTLSSKGENTVKVTVTSKSKDTRMYTIIATKQDDNGLKLEKLEIKDATLEPEFSENKYTYKAKMEIIKEEDELKPLEIVTKANSESAEIEILGNSNLSEGDNLITILVKDDEDVTTYQVNVNISSKKKITTIEETSNKFVETVDFCKDKIIEWFSDNTRKIATIIAGAVVLLVIIILIIVKIYKKHQVKKKAENIKKRAK